jgi:hypothetical protein
MIALTTMLLLLWHMGTLIGLHASKLDVLSLGSASSWQVGWSHTKLNSKETVALSFTKAEFMAAVDVG